MSNKTTIQERHIFPNKENNLNLKDQLDYKWIFNTNPNIERGLSYKLKFISNYIKTEDMITNVT
jgi:hypothetical protein